MCQECAKAAAAGTAIPTTAYHATPSARCNMDSSRPRNSTRAGKARSGKSLPGSRRKPVVRKASKTRARAAAIGPLRKARHGIPVAILRQIQGRIRQICSTAIVVAHALRKQNVELDDDAADVLRWHVSDPLFEQILLLKRVVDRSAS